MKHKIQQTLMLVTSLFCSSVGWAQDAGTNYGNLTIEQAQLQEGVGYTLATNGRNFWYSNTSKLVTSKDGGVTTLDPADSAAVFGFVNYSGSTYVYSVGQKKFLKRDVTLDVKGDPVYIFDSGSGGDYRYFFSFTIDKSNYNINDNGSLFVFNGWNNPDTGDQFKVTATALTFDPMVARTSLAMGITANSKADLLSLIQKAAALGVDVTEAQAIYDAPLATLDEIQVVKTALSDAMASLATPEHPADMTAKIINPTFNENSDGWESTVTGIDNIKGVDNRMEFPPAFTGKSWVNENGSNSFMGRMHQVVTGLPNGVYKVGLAAYVSTLHLYNLTDSLEYVFANDSKKLLDSATPKLYHWFVNVTDGTLDIGLAQDSILSNRTYIDNASLTYFGNTLASFQYMGQALREEVNSLFGEGTTRTFTQSYFDAVNTIADEISTSTTPEDALAAYNRGLQAAAALYANANYYDRVDEEIKNLDIYILQLGFDMVDQQDELQMLYDDHSATNEKLSELLASIYDAEVAFIKENIHGADDAFPKGQEYPFIVNSSFEGGSAAGWNLTGADSGGGASGVEEFWAKKGYDMHQDFTGMKPGVWRFEVEGFYRAAGGAGGSCDRWNSAQGENTGQNTVYSFFGINSRSTTFPNYASHGLDMAALGYGAETNPNTTDINYKKRNDNYWGIHTLWRPDGEVRVWLPDRIYGADDYFHFNDDYVKSLTGFVGPDGKLTIRINNTDYANVVGDEWTLIGDTHLYYVGSDADLVRPYLQELIDSADVVVAHPMPAGVKQTLETAIVAAKTSVAGSNGIDMITCYTNLQKAISDTKESADKYVQLNGKVNELLDNVDIYAESASQEAKNAATSLYDEVTKKMLAGSYSVDQINEVIAQIDKSIYDLKVPTGVATDDAPQNWTFTIRNPKYLEGTAGWNFTIGSVEQEPDFGLGVAEGWSKNFDTYQDIYGLPKGTYKVQVQGFYRQQDGGKNVLSYQLFYADQLGKVDKLSLQAQAATLFVNRGRFYANADTIIAKSVTFIPADDTEKSILASAPGNGGWATYIDSLTTNVPATYYFPDNRARAATRFGAGMYVNELYTQVGDDGHLRIGAYNGSSLAGDWVVFTNWELTYFGTNSKYAQATGIAAVGSEEVVSRKVFTVDGRQVNSLQKGINIIRTTTAGGKTTIRKVIVR